jgi:hypothetical protein
MRLAITTFTFCFIIGGDLVFATSSADTAAQISRRQLADCMLKRMTSDRTLSYNDASKACKDQLKGSKTDAALNKPAPSKPVS